MKIINKIVFVTLVMIFIVSCTSKKEKLSKAIYYLETSDSSSTPKGMNDLAEMYFDYSNQFTKDSMAEAYLYKGFMFKYITNHWDDAIKFANFYKSNYPVSENYHTINLKLADVYDLGKHNLDSAMSYYMLAKGKARFSSDDYRKAGNTLERWVSKNANPSSTATGLYNAAIFYQTANDFENAIKLYLQLANIYPDYDNSPDALMAAGFIYWDNLKEPEKAKTCYKQLVEKYPRHPLAKEAQTLLTENILNMTDLELSEYLMKKNKEKGLTQ
ncbi:MAG: tetratricopeptide repeat protein [Bacteroidia bacterium]